MFCSPLHHQILEQCIWDITGAQLVYVGRKEGNSVGGTALAQWPAQAFHCRGQCQDFPVLCFSKEGCLGESKLEQIVERTGSGSMSSVRWAGRERIPAECISSWAAGS